MEDPELLFPIQPRRSIALGNRFPGETGFVRAFQNVVNLRGQNGSADCLGSGPEVRTEYCVHCTEQDDPVKSTG